MEEPRYKSLQLSQVNTSLMVVSSLTSDTKLAVENNTFLKVDDAYFSYLRNTTRNDVVEFIEHLYKETNRLFIITYNQLQENKKSPADKEHDRTITEIHSLYNNVILFLSKFDHVINVYSSDTLIKARLEELKDKFKSLEYNFFRNIIIV